MTDIMKLADAYAWYSVHGAETTVEPVIGARDALQEVIEALQAENEQFRLLAKANSEALGAALAERDQLQAKLDAMGKGEPVSGNVEILLEAAEVLDKVRSQCDDAWGRFGLRDYLPDELHGTALIVRDAAPKALAPLTDEQIYETIIQWDEGGGKRSRRELAHRLTRLTNQQQQVANLILHDGLQIASPIESNSGLGTDIEYRFEVSDGNKRIGVIVIFTELADHEIHAKGGQHEDA